MADGLTIHYCFDFPTGECKEFAMALDGATLRLMASPTAAPPFWARLENHQCPGCRISPESQEFCPIALNMVQIVEEFKDYFSYEDVKVTVTTQERSYRKETTLQAGLSSLLGIIMVSSGCPAMEKLKPMVRFHLPFASIEETIFRTISMYLVSRYYRKRRGEVVDWSLAGMVDLYASVGVVNKAFAERLREAAKKDANVNALVNLFCFSEIVPFAAEEMLDQLENHFSALLVD